MQVAYPMNVQHRYRRFIHALGVYQLCRPLVVTIWSQSVWNGYIAMSDIFYQHIFPYGCLILLYPSLMGLLIWGGKNGRLLSFLYIIALLPIIVYEDPNRRYLIPFYPLIVLIIALQSKRLSGILPMKKGNGG